MPSNTKSWDKIKRTDFDLLQQGLRAKGYIPPYGDSGLLRSHSGMYADMAFQEAEEALTVRIRQGGKGETYSSIFQVLDDTIKSTNR